MKPNATHIEADGLSRAWFEALKTVVERGEIAPLIVTFPAKQNDGNRDTPEVRTALDEMLGPVGKFSCGTVSNTIFPGSLWNPNEPSSRLYSAYLQVLPVLWKNRRNKRGLYFERLIDYGNNKNPGSGFNQLARVIENWHTGPHRRSGLQASIFDALNDHIKAPYLGFPCLHQIAFTPLNNGAGLGITGYYGHEYIVDKAYGNYLGLAKLGEFMAHEMGLKLEQISVVASVASLGSRKISKAQLKEFIKSTEQYL